MVCALTVTRNKPMLPSVAACQLFGHSNEKTGRVRPGLQRYSRLLSPFPPGALDPMPWAGLGRTEQPSSNMGTGASAPLPGPDLHLIFLSEVTFDLGPEQPGKVLCHLLPWPSHHRPASTSLKGGLRVAKDLTPSANTKTKHPKPSPVHGWAGSCFRPQRYPHHL